MSSRSRLRAVDESEARMSYRARASLKTWTKVSVTFPPLHEAALNGHIPCLEILIENSANLEKNENQFGTALHVACLGHVGCVKVLLQAGANPNSIRRHQVPLHATAMNRDEVCTALILEFRANAYLRDLESKKPVKQLMRHAKRCFLKLVRI
ncbi:hypothetical protein pdam_00007493 [Pocillopora damicornis]|uniref:Uncharacterized protein n=1 Tax=Pocillopora damicornis TaxID=46731 RepID=A0A3M6TGJ9_POCDA|nr:hypothetical protein pdam_00007493 [Pocillopora damicornis]